MCLKLLSCSRSAGLRVWSYGPRFLDDGSLLTIDAVGQSREEEMDWADGHGPRIGVNRLNVGRMPTSESVEVQRHEGGLYFGTLRGVGVREAAPCVDAALPWRAPAEVSVSPLTRGRHARSVERGGELLLGDAEFRQLLCAELAHGLTGGDGVFRDLGRRLVTDHRGEAGDH